MIKRYHLIIAAIALLSMLTSSLFAIFSNQLHVVPAILIVDLVLLGGGGWLLARRQIGPIEKLLADGDLDAMAVRRLRRLPENSAIMLLPLIFLRWVCLVSYEYFDIPEGQFEGSALAMRLGAEIWWMVQGAIYYPIIVYFAVSDFVSDLRRQLFDKHDLNLPARNKTLRLELTIVFCVLVTLPMLSVLFDVLFFSAARAAYGLNLATHVAFDVLVSLLAVMIAIYFVVRDLTRPILALRDAVARVSDGDLESHTPITTDDEIGQLAGEFNELIDDIREREFIKETFGKYVPPSVVPKILEDKGRLEGDVRLATLMFTDIENFTGIVEDMSPTATIEMLNDYFSITLPIIRKHGGIVNAMIGDAIFASFNVPVDDPEHGEKSILTAIEIQRALAGRTFANGVALNTRCGINTGEVVAGSVGSKDRMNFTLLGDEVNLAARVEQLNKEIGSYVLVTQSTYDLTADKFQFEDADEWSVKGKLERVRLYKVLFDIEG